MPNDIYQADAPLLSGDVKAAVGEEAREHGAHAPTDGNILSSLVIPNEVPPVHGRRERSGTVCIAEIDETLSHPGSVRINVKGAFIVDQDSSTPTHSDDGRSGSPGRSPVRHETQDIRLPNHTAVVSHIAIDVGSATPEIHNDVILLIGRSRLVVPLPSLSTSPERLTRPNRADGSTSRVLRRII